MKGRARAAAGARRVGRWARRAAGRTARRAARPLTSKRSGHFYIWSRALRTRLRRSTAPDGVDAVSLDALSARAAGATYRELEPAVAEVTPPPGWVWPRNFCSSEAFRRPPPRGQGVVDVVGGVVFGWRGEFGPDPAGVLADACALWEGGEALVLDDAVKALAVGIEELDGTTMSVWANGQNYAHCLLQSVPRLALLRRGFGLEADRFLVNADAPRATTEALSILGVPEEQRCAVPMHGPAYRCERLRAATSPRLEHVGARWTTEFLHELFLPEPPATGGRRLYVQRGVATRAVLNEDDVLALLEPAGFEALTMHDRSIREQAALFAGAEIVVGSHGAALANLVFCDPGTTVVELMGTNTASTAFTYLSWRRGLRYRMIMGTEPAPPRRWWTWRVDADTVVDVPRLRETLEQLGHL